MKINRSEKSTICGRTIQIDRSGVGHNWQNVDSEVIPADDREEVAAEIIDGGKLSCDKYVATSGVHYRW